MTFADPLSSKRPKCSPKISKYSGINCSESLLKLQGGMPIDKSHEEKV